MRGRVTRAIGAVTMDHFRTSMNALQITEVSQDKLSSSVLLLLVPLVLSFVFVRQVAFFFLCADKV